MRWRPMLAAIRNRRIGLRSSSSTAGTHQRAGECGTALVLCRCRRPSARPAFARRWRAWVWLKACGAHPAELVGRAAAVYYQAPWSRSPRSSWPTSPRAHSDSQTSEGHYGLLAQLNAQGITVVLVTHRARRGCLGAPVASCCATAPSCDQAQPGHAQQAATSHGAAAGARMNRTPRCAPPAGAHGQPAAQRAHHAGHHHWCGRSHHHAGRAGARPSACRNRSRAWPNIVPVVPGSLSAACAWGADALALYRRGCRSPGSARPASAGGRALVAPRPGGGAKRQLEHHHLRHHQRLF